MKGSSACEQGEHSGILIVNNDDDSNDANGDDKHRSHS